MRSVVELLSNTTELWIALASSPNAAEVLSAKAFQQIAIVFFCQAEDGIRDDLVTGVQTCALPISYHDHALPQAARKAGACSCRRAAPRGRRSEERRVGKECRSRWSPDHEKKNRTPHASDAACPRPPPPSLAPPNRPTKY